MDEIAYGLGWRRVKPNAQERTVASEQFLELRFDLCKTIGFMPVSQGVVDAQQNSLFGSGRG